MESFQSVKQRLKGIQNISQITKAMELVAATKMRRSQEIALNSRPYAFAALDLLATLSEIEEGKAASPLLAGRPVKTSAALLVSSDKGLAGAFNSGIFRRFDAFMAGQNKAKTTHAFIAIGKKAAAHLVKRGRTPSAAYVRAGDFTTVTQVAPIAARIVEGYLEGEWDEMVAFSTHFRSALKQEVVERRLLPVSAEAIKKAIRELVPETGRFAGLRGEAHDRMPRAKTPGYRIEPSPREVIEVLAAHLVQMELYHLLMEANASEHAARRMAMKNASENAGELARNLTITYNKIRQAAITKEIVEITAGAEALQA